MTPNRFRDLRGFSLAEVVMALALLALVAVLFTPMIGNSGANSDKLVTQTKLSAALNVMVDNSSRTGVASAPTCAGTLTTTTTGALTNRWNIANPCDLNTVAATDVVFVGGNVPAAANSVSVAARLTPLTSTSGAALQNWDATVTAPVINSSTDTPVSCLAVTRAFPSGAEKYYEIPLPSGGCDAAGVEPVIKALTCPTGKGERWATRCQG